MESSGLHLGKGTEPTHRSDVEFVCKECAVMLMAGNGLCRYQTLHLPATIACRGVSLNKGMTDQSALPWQSKAKVYLLWREGFTPHCVTFLEYPFRGTEAWDRSSVGGEGSPGPLLQPPTQSRGITSTKWAWPWLCLAMPWKLPRMQMPQPRWVTRDACLSQGRSLSRCPVWASQDGVVPCKIICLYQEEFGSIISAGSCRLLLTYPFTSLNQPRPIRQSLAGQASQGPEHLHSSPFQFLQLNWDQPDLVVQV